MSTIPKAIQEEAEKRFPTIPSSNYNVARKSSFIAGGEYGYQLATDGREELEKEWLCECKKEHGFTLVAGYSYCNNCGKRY